MVKSENWSRLLFLSIGNDLLCFPKSEEDCQETSPLESLCAPSDVEDTPARRDQEEERQAHVPELQCERRYRGGNLRHSNHSVLEENHNCIVWKGARGCGENVNQRTACLRRHKGAADGGTACTSPPTYDFSALQRDGGQESCKLNRQQTVRSSDVQPIGHCYTTGSPTAKLKSREQQNSCLPQAGTNKRKGFNHQYCREPWRPWDTEDSASKVKPLTVYH